MTDEINQAVRNNPAVQNATGVLIEEVANVAQTLRAFMGQVNTVPTGEIVNILQIAHQQLGSALATSGRVSVVEGFITEEVTKGLQDNEAGEQTSSDAAPQPRARKTATKAKPRAAAKRTTRKKG